MLIFSGAAASRDNSPARLVAGRDGRPDASQRLSMPPPWSLPVFLVARVYPLFC
jgi:hypothetical protein